MCVRAWNYGHPRELSTSAQYLRCTTIKSCLGAACRMAAATDFAAQLAALGPSIQVGPDGQPRCTTEVQELCEAMSGQLSRDYHVASNSSEGDTPIGHFGAGCKRPYQHQMILCRPAAFATHSEICGSAGIRTLPACAVA